MIKQHPLPVLISLLSLFACFHGFRADAQNNTRSPYSNRGVGEPESSDYALNKSLGGISNGLRSSRFVSIANPASLGGLLKQQIVFDFGLRGDYGQTKSNTGRYEYNNGNFNYISLAMPVLTRYDFSKNSKDSATRQKTPDFRTVWAMAVGMSPYSAIGSYYFKQTDTTFADYTTTFSNSGGLTNVYLANGFNVSKNLSVGITTSFVFGQVVSYKFQYFTDTNQYYHFDDERIYYMKGFKNDLGIQYHATFGKTQKWSLVAGATYTLTSNLKYNLTRLSRSYDNSFLRDTLLYENNVKGKTDLPPGFSVGYSLTYNKKWMLAMEYRQDNWADQKKALFRDSFNNSSKLSVGLAFRPDTDPGDVKLNDKQKFKFQPEYRLGFHYTNTGYNVKGQDGTIEPIKEYGISFGVGIPKISGNRPRVKSMINLTGEYIMRGKTSNGLLQENIYRLTIGFTLNDVWFRKPKFN